MLYEFPLATSTHPNQQWFVVTLHQSLLFLFSQDEKNQVLTTYIWYRQVSPRTIPAPPSLQPHLPALPHSPRRDARGKAGCCQPALIFAYLIIPALSPADRSWHSGSFQNWGHLPWMQERCGAVNSTERKISFEFTLYLQASSPKTAFLSAQLLTHLWFLFPVTAQVSINEFTLKQGP